MNKKIILSALTATIIATTFSGCYSSYQPTPEQQAQANQLRELAIAQMKKQLMNFGKDEEPKQQEQPKMVTSTAITQDELKTKIEALGVANAPVVFSRTKSGFSINDKPFSDYEGAIKQAGWDMVSGLVTYLVQTAPDTYVMKTTQATSRQEPLVVANVRFNRGTWQINSVTGKNLTGDTLIIGSKGFVVTRVDGSGFLYEHSLGIKSINVPTEYQVAKFQNGDIAGTKTILLEIPEAKQSDDGGLATLWSKTKALGSVLGINKKQDYAFMNLDSGKLTKINIPNDGKSTMQCLQHGEQINKFVRKCLKYADPVESLYDVQTGLKNFDHYFWRIQWTNTPSGVVALTQEDGLGKIYATNLSSEKKVLLAQKLGGFAGYDLSVKTGGKIELNAYKGIFGTDTVEDIENKINTLPAVIVEEK